MRPIVHGPAARSALAGAVLGFVLVTLVAREEHVSKVPPTRRDDIVEVIHGERVADPYRWLEDVAAPEVKAWMKAQDGYTRDFLRELPGRAALKIGRASCRERVGRGGG